MDKNKNYLGDHAKDFKFAKEEKTFPKSNKFEVKEEIKEVKEVKEVKEIKEVKEELKNPLTEEEINIAAKKILHTTNLFTSRYLELPSYDKITLKTNAIPANVLKKLIDGYGMQALRATSDSLILFFPEGTLYGQLTKVEKVEKVENEENEVDEEEIV